ncbi:MAG: hypothetical protein M1136_10605 [Chloroflexi bacterium]|nr:hypothetical protein [Chloroflexota bacterium]MCL5076076.1 hypothetical protein [Chloroflexota bacterium]
MNVMRYTVIDWQGAVSFVADCQALTALVAACADGADTLGKLLDFSARYDPQLCEYVTSGLAVFDEHNGGSNYEAIHQALRYCRPHELPVFRVVDDETRKASLQSVKAGAIIFNLLDRRIVQIQNTFAEVKRTGKVRLYEAGILHRYELPPSWSVVPGRG